LSEKPGFETLTENRQRCCWCRLFRQGVPDTVKILLPTVESLTGGADSVNAI